MTQTQLEVHANVECKRDIFFVSSGRLEIAEKNVCSITCSMNITVSYVIPWSCMMMQSDMYTLTPKQVRQDHEVLIGSIKQLHTTIDEILMPDHDQHHHAWII